MENILPTELEIRIGGMSSRLLICAKDQEEILGTSYPQHKEVIELMVKLYNEYMKNGSGCISVEESKPKFGKVWPSK